MPFSFPIEYGQTICWTCCTDSMGCTKVDPHYQISCHFLLKGIQTTWSSPSLWEDTASLGQLAAWFWH